MSIRCLSSNKQMTWRIIQFCGTFWRNQMSIRCLSSNKQMTWPIIQFCGTFWRNRNQKNVHPLFIFFLFVAVTERWQDVSHSFVEPFGKSKCINVHPLFIFFMFVCVTDSRRPSTGVANREIGRLCQLCRLFWPIVPIGIALCAPILFPDPWALCES